MGNEKGVDEVQRSITFIVILMTLSIMLFSVSYAVLSTEIVGQKSYTIQVGTFDFEIQNTTNSIQLVNAYPLADSEGKKLNPHTFTLKNTGTIAQDYRIYLVEDRTERENVVLLDANMLRCSLIVDGIEQGVMDVSSELLLTKGNLQPEEMSTFELRLWLREDATIEEENKSYYGTIRVEAEQEVEKPAYAMMKKRDSSSLTEAFWQYADSITSIVFENSINIPSEIEEDKKWDVSADGSGSVMAYIELDMKRVIGKPDVSTPYRLHIQGENGISANTDSGFLFGGFYQVTTIEGLEYFDTSNVTDMFDMFAGCSSLTSLDLSNFNTSNVTNMRGMFNGCSSLTNLDISHFDTSNVTDMFDMFAGCSSLTSLDLSNFNTSNVTSMRRMFNGCSSLTSLDLSSFDTSNVTSMRDMFSGCSSLTSLDLSSFDTIQITILLQKKAMFDNVKNDCLITVKDEATKAWVLDINNTLTNVNVKRV